MIKYDSIIIGGSINSLAAAAFLSKKGEKVLLIAPNDTLGGLLQTNKFAPGFTCNMMYDHINWINPRIIKNLNLEKYGVKLEIFDIPRIALDRKNKHILFNSDPNKTAESISIHSKNDASKWLDFSNHIQKLTNFLEPVYNSVPPKISSLGIKDIIALKGMVYPLKNYGTKGLVETIRTLPMMMPEFLDEWFESTLLRGSLSTSGISHITQGPYSAATMLNFLHQHMYSNGTIHNTMFIKNGPSTLIDVCAKIAHTLGVEIKTGCKIEYIDCKDSICKGISLENGNSYSGSKIISSLDPTHTFMKLIGNQHLPPSLRTQIENIKYRGTVARVHFGLHSLPGIQGVSKEQMQSIFSISPSINYLERAYDDCKYGKISKEPYIEFSFPTICNPAFAKAGKHVLSATVQYVPYHLKNEDWNENVKNNIIQTVKEIIEKYIPKFSSYIENTAITTPIDLENSFGITEGNINNGEMTLDQFFFMRPTISTAQYHTPIQNLYLCGPGTHPGGGNHLTDVENLLKIIK